jgi:hypothetical protein
MDQDAIHLAALLKVRLPRGLAMDHRQVVAELSYGPYGHAVRDENDGQATLSRRQVERDAVRVAVAGHHRETEAPVLEDVEISRVVANQFDNAKHFEELVPPMQ